MVENSLEMSRVFNEYFGIVFTRENSYTIPVVITENQNEDIGRKSIESDKPNEEYKAAGVLGQNL